MIQFLILGFLLSTSVMLFTWLFARAKNNYSVVDAVWAYLFFALVGVYSFFGKGLELRKELILFCVGIWSLRLGTFLTIRIYSHHPKEDSRYLELRRHYGEHLERGFFLFFLYQAWSVMLLTIPFLFISQNDLSHLKPVEIVGITLFVFSFFGEAVSDHQMKRFKLDPKNAGKNCEVGFWRYSRHPNYFFESCIWWGYYLFALGSPLGVYTIYCPILMLFLLLKVTGVPIAEKQSLKSRGEVYRDYQRRTSVFFPWFPKK